MVRRLIPLLLLLTGFCIIGTALYNLCITARFVYEADVIIGTVDDERERPFRNWAEMLANGCMPWEGKTAHCPIVRYTFHSLNLLADNLPDLDTADFTDGERIRIIRHPLKPVIRIYSFRHLWLGDILSLIAGILFLPLGHYIMRRRIVSNVRTRHGAPTAVTPKQSSASQDATGAGTPPVSSVLPHRAAPTPPHTTAKTAPRNRRGHKTVSAVQKSATQPGVRKKRPTSPGRNNAAPQEKKTTPVRRKKQNQSAT